MCIVICIFFPESYLVCSSVVVNVYQLSVAPCGRAGGGGGAARARGKTGKREKTGKTGIMKMKTSIMRMWMKRGWSII